MNFSSKTLKGYGIIAPMRAQDGYLVRNLTVTHSVKILGKDGYDGCDKHL
jgi:hypothetical protein